MKLFFILGNQLFPLKYVDRFKKDHSFYMAEDYELCTYEKHHKQKILLFLSSMRSYADMLKANKYKVEYSKIEDKDFKDTYFKEVFDVLSSKYKLGRVRILLKEPRSTLSWHRDPEPRLHIPLITNPGCLMVIDNVAKHMPADGSVWVTNNTKYHNAFNGGEENRVHLVACVLDYKFN